MPDASSSTILRSNHPHPQGHRIHVSDWLIWQMIDSAFPTGGFAHSGGLEAARQQGEIPGRNALIDFLKSSLEQLAHSTLPFVAACCRNPARFAELDALLDATVSNHVANRASRSQGRALAAVAERVLGQKMPFTAQSPGHLPVVFGAVVGHLGVPVEQAMRMFIYMSLRAMISAGVRLGIVGPTDGQAVQLALADTLEHCCNLARGTDPEDATQTAPLLEILSANQDRLYSRLFIS